MTTRIDSEAAYIATAAASLGNPCRPRTERELWQPDRRDQIDACVTLLASPIPQEVRLHVRDLYEDLVRRAA